MLTIYAHIWHLHIKQVGLFFSLALATPGNVWDPEEPKSLDESKVGLLKAWALGLSNSTGSPSKVQVNHIS